MKRIAWIILFTFVVVNLVGLTVFMTETRAPSNSNNSSNTTNTANNTVNANSAEKISAAQLAEHNSRTNCWIAYGGKVYDITSWLPEHPGSADAIAPFCGTSSEFESAFQGQHGQSQVQRLLQEGTYKGDLA
jgi:cytochrome b involved in lipid metabolism